MKTFVPQKPANARPIATTIDFGAASAAGLPHPSRGLHLSSRVRPRAIAPEAKQRITAAPLQIKLARDAECGKQSGS